MNTVTITTPILADVDTIWRWGEENWQMWGGPGYKWYSKEELRTIIQNPKNAIFLVAKDGNKPVGLCLTYNL